MNRERIDSCALICSWWSCKMVYKDLCSLWEALMTLIACLCSLSLATHGHSDVRIVLSLWLPHSSVLFAFKLLPCELLYPLESFCLPLSLSFLDSPFATSIVFRCHISDTNSVLFGLSRQDQLVLDAVLWSRFGPELLHVVEKVLSVCLLLKKSTLEVLEAN